MKKHRNNYWYALLLGCLMFISAYSQFQLSPISDQVIEKYGLTTQSFGSLFTAPMVPAVFLSILAGVMIDKIGAKLIIFSASAISVLGIVWRIFATDGTSLFWAMALSGVVAAVINSSVAKVAGLWFSVEKVGSVVGMVMAFGSVGMILAMSTTSLLGGVNQAFILAGILAVGIAGIVFVGLKFPVKDKGQAAGAEAEAILETLKKVLKSLNIWLTGICAAFVMGLNICLSSYLPMAFQSRGVTSGAAGILTTVFLLGAFVGTASGPSIMNRYFGLKRYCLFFSFLSVLGGALGWQLEQVPLVGIGLFVTGFGIGSFLPIFLSMPMFFKEIGPRYAATGGGVIATLQLLGAVVLPTYVYVPIAGENFFLLFLLASSGLLVVALLSQFIRVES